MESSESTICNSQKSNECAAQSAQPKEPETDPECTPENCLALAACQEEQRAWKEKYVKVTADLENFRRRMEKDQGVWTRVAQVRLLSDLLPVIDDIERAQELMSIQKPDPSEDRAAIEAWAKGLNLITDAWHKVLAKYEVQEVDCSSAFDPEYHEAIMQVDSDDHEPGTIVQVLKKGYMLGNTVLRPAQVSVAR